MIGAPDCGQARLREQALSAPAAVANSTNTPPVGCNRARAGTLRPSWERASRGPQAMQGSVRAAKHQGIPTGVRRQDKARDLPVAEIADEADAGDVAGGREERRHLVHRLAEGVDLRATVAPSATLTLVP